MQIHGPAGSMRPSCTAWQATRVPSPASSNSGRSAREYARMMGGSAGVLAEIERAEAERKAGPAAKGTYGPGV